MNAHWLKDKGLLTKLNVVVTTMQNSKPSPSRHEKHKESKDVDVVLDYGD